MDYKSLNEITIKDKYPLPHLDDLVSNLNQVRYFTTMNLKNGFFHINVEESAVKYTAFVKPQGQF